MLGFRYQVLGFRFQVSGFRFQETNKKNGFTLVELIVVVALLGVLSAIGIPIYTGYADTARVTTVQNNLRAIYLQQQEYLAANNAYYGTGAGCSSDQRGSINVNLFAGEEFLKADGYRYCVLQSDPMEFTAHAEEADGSRVFTLTHDNVESW